MVIVIVAVVVAVIIVVVAVDEETTAIIISSLGAAFVSSLKILNVMKKGIRLVKLKALLFEVFRSFKQFMIVDVSLSIAEELEKKREIYDNLDMEGQCRFLSDIICNEVDNYHDDALGAVVQFFTKAIKESKNE